MIKDFFIVTKFVLSFLATFSVLLVAMGVSTLNQVQEYKEDSKMERTKNRPIASGRMSPRTGIIISVTLILISFVLIYSLLGLTGINFFAFAFIWYNLMYTPLKKKSALAVVPGAILGVIPPAIGWLVAGHSLFELEFYTLAAFYFIWQVPHFWLLVMLFHGDYKDGGYPTAMRLFGEGTLQRLTYVWLNLTIFAGVFMVYTFNVYSMITIGLITLLAIWSFVTSLELLKKEFKLTDARAIFWKINAAFLGTIILLSIDEYIKHHV
jgi:protoheme IX farnesyltransferase